MNTQASPGQINLFLQLIKNVCTRRCTHANEKAGCPDSPVRFQLELFPFTTQLLTQLSLK